MGYVGGHWYSEPPACQRCGGALASEAEWCRCGGRSQFYSEQRANRHHGADEWSPEADELLGVEARSRPSSTRRMAEAEARWVLLMAELRARHGLE